MNATEVVGMNATHPTIRLPSLALACALGLSTAPPRAQEARLPADEPDDRVCEDDPMAEPPDAMQTPLCHPPKADKPPRSRTYASKRRGYRRVITTLYNVHTNEAVPVLKGRRPPADVLDHLFRCRGFDLPHALDVRLIDAILRAASHFESLRAEIISAYRSPKFNDSLAKKGRGVAAESRHSRGQAVDFRLSDVGARELGRWLESHFSGGVGTYVADNFVHIDVGPKRRWSGR